MSEYFADIPEIPFEGPESKNPLAFKFYNQNEKIGGKTMKEHLRFSMAYWHTMTGGGVDPFGAATMRRPWSDISDPMARSKAMMEAAFEIMTKLGIGLYCFHDRDIAPAVDDISETNAMLDEIVDVAEGLMKQTGIKLLWGTANMFHHPRFAHGAGTSCSADVFAYAAAQVKKALEVTNRLGGDGYVFWGGREGYETLLNTDMGLELDNLARLLHMAVDYANEIGFQGQFLIEPKPKEPTKHQYDFDAATVAGFLRQYDLIDSFKLNLETNHATLAGHTFEHDLRFARVNGILGSVDANQGDLLLGWDTDQFPTNIYVTTFAMIEILKNGGLGRGGLNFDAKPRRASFEPKDIFLSHIAGMDGFAKGLKTAYAIIESGELDTFVADRYASYTSGIGKQIVDGSVGLKELAEYAQSNANGREADALTSGGQEMLESIVNRYIG